MKYVFNEDFFKTRIIYSFLPYGIKACVSSIPKIIINVCGNNIKSFVDDKNNEEYMKILKALYTIIFLEEIINLIRRDKPNESLTKEYDYKDGKSFIYHIFDGFVILYMDSEFANVILSKDSWKKDSKELKNQFLRFKGKKDDDIINSLKERGGIKCYDSIIEEDVDFVEEDFCCKLTV